MRANAGGVEYRVGEIYLAVDEIAEQPRVEEQARPPGGGACAAAPTSRPWRAPSRKAARPLPEAISAGCRATRVDWQIAAVLLGLAAGDRRPIRSAQGGYFILDLADRRTGGRRADGKYRSDLAATVSAALTTAATGRLKSAPREGGAGHRRRCAQLRRAGRVRQAIREREVAQSRTVRGGAIATRRRAAYHVGWGPARALRRFGWPKRFRPDACDRQVQEPGVEAARGRRTPSARSAALRHVAAAAAHLALGRCWTFGCERVLPA